MPPFTQRRRRRPQYVTLAQLAAATKPLTVMYAQQQHEIAALQTSVLDSALTARVAALEAADTALVGTNVQLQAAISAVEARVTALEATVAAQEIEILDLQALIS